MKNKNQKIKLFNSLFVIVLGIFLLPSLAYLSSITDNRIIELTNKERIKYNIPVLTENEILSVAARTKGEYILKTQKFQHNFDDRKFSAWIKEAGYKYQYAGENLAIDFFTSEGALKAWMDSPTHRENILNEKFQEIGIAVIEGNYEGHDAILIVQIFGTPLNPTIVKKNETDAQFAGTTRENLKANDREMPYKNEELDNFFYNTFYQSLAIILPLIIIYLLFRIIKIGEHIKHNNLQMHPKIIR